jgi:alpha-1,3-rhamnosyl/mannosyltransferase
MANVPTLVVAGAWDERYPEAKLLAERMGSECPVLFAGPISDADLPGLYTGARLFVFPSLYEGFGLPVLEAMACGTPVSCSGTSSMPEVAGDAAAYFDAASSESIAATILDLLADDERLSTMTRKGIEQASTFSWESTAARTLQLYRFLADSKGHGKTL